LTLALKAGRKFAPLLAPARYKGAHGGRGSGKSHFFAEMLVARANSQLGFRAACLREVQKSLKNSVKLLVEDKIRKHGLSDRFEVLEAEIRTPGGGIIIFQGMLNHTADSIKSLEGFDVAWVEEAQSLSQRSLDLLRPTIRKPGSELWFSWNPNKPTDPVDALLRGPNPPSNSTIVEVNYDANPWMPPELTADMEDDRDRDIEKYNHVWGGDYSHNSVARVFRNWKVEKFETPKDALYRFGADWGFAQDPTALVRCYIVGRNLYVDAEAVEVGCEIDETPALFAGDCPADYKDQYGNPRWSNDNRRPGIAGALTSLIRADNARPETVSYMKRQGFKITEAVKGPGSLEDGVQFLKMFDIVVHPRCRHVAAELRDYSYKVDPQTEEVMSVLEDKNNHTIDALRYAVEELRRSGWKPKADGPPKPKDMWATPDRTEGDWRTA
jgi:phage terminase large subunit